MNESHVLHTTLCWTVSRIFKAQIASVLRSILKILTRAGGAHRQWRTEDGVRGLEPLPLAYDLRNERVRMRQNMVFSTKIRKIFS